MKLTSAILLASMFAAVTSVIAGANAAEVTGARITGMGVYLCENTRSVSAPGTPGNSMDLVSGCRLEVPTRTIQAAIGTRFGCGYVIDGSPMGELVKTSIRWRFPAQGLNDGPGGKVHFWADYTQEDSIGAGRAFRYQFDYPWELVPGNWTMEIRNGDRKLAECKFNVVVP